MMTHEARVAAVMERVRARVQLRKQRRMAGVLVLAALAAGFALGGLAYHRNALLPKQKEEPYEKTNFEYLDRPGPVPGAAARHSAGGGRN